MILRKQRLRMKYGEAMQNITIKISSIVGGGICVSAADGNKVYAQISKAVEDGHRVRISFSGVTRMTTAFLNAAVGQLYGEYAVDRIRRQLAPPVDFEDWHLKRLKLVVDRAKEYFADADRVEAAFKSTLGDEDGSI